MAICGTDWAMNAGMGTLPDMARSHCPTTLSSRRATRGALNIGQLFQDTVPVRGHEHRAVFHEQR